MDKQKNNQQGIRSELIRSPSLYLKEFKAKEDASSRGNRLISGTRIKSVVMPMLYWLLQHVPVIIAKAPVRLLVIDFFERMGVTIVMVRGGNFFELTRTLFSILKPNKAIGATVDSFDRSESRVEADMFNTKIGFNPWAAKIAARLGAPLAPSYFISQGKQITAEFGPALISKNIEELIQHYVRYFERSILENPASWAFLADRRWAKVLREASQKIT